MLFLLWKVSVISIWQKIWKLGEYFFQAWRIIDKCMSIKNIYMPSVLTPAWKIQLFVLPEVFRSSRFRPVSKTVWKCKWNHCHCFATSTPWYHLLKYPSWVCNILLVVLLIMLIKSYMAIKWGTVKGFITDAFDEGPFTVNNHADVGFETVLSLFDVFRVRCYLSAS